MSKELPYFKFYVNEWITGDITLETFEVQGLFVNICAYYWSKECSLTFTMLKKKFRDVKPELFDILILSKIIKVNEDRLSINFMDEQFNSKLTKAVSSRENGKKGGRPKVEKEPKITQAKPKHNPDHNLKEPNIEERRGEEKREEKNNTIMPSAEFLKIIEQNEDDHIWMEKLVKKFGFESAYQANLYVNLSFRKHIQESVIDKGEVLNFSDYKHVRNASEKWYKETSESKQATAKRKFVQ